MKLKAFGVILVIAAFTAVIAGCVAPTPVAPSVASTTSDQAAAGLSIFGNVVYGSEPMAGARVDLRLPDWNATQNPDSTVASATVGADGRYVIENSPVGDYSLVAVWPDGEDSEGGWPAVQISAGRQMTAPSGSPANITQPPVGARVSARSSSTSAAAGRLRRPLTRRRRAQRQPRSPLPRRRLYPPAQPSQAPTCPRTLPTAPTQRAWLR